MEFWNKRIELNPYDLEARYRRGTLLIDQGRLEDARNDFNFIIENDKSDEAVYVLQSLREIYSTYDCMGEYQKAIFTLSKFKNHKNEDVRRTIYGWIGICYASQNEMVDALENFSKETTSVFRSLSNTFGCVFELKNNLWNGGNKGKEPKLVKW